MKKVHANDNNGKCNDGSDNDLRDNDGGDLIFWARAFIPFSKWT